MNYQAQTNDELIDQLKSGFSEPDFAPILDAFNIPVPHDPEKTARPRGIEVALVLKNLGVDATTVNAAILSDPRLQKEIDEAWIEDRFGYEVANLVKNVRWLNTFNVYSRDVISDPNQAEILRRMLLAMVDDVRAVLIKLAYRIERLRKLPKENYEVRRYIAQETLDIYSRLANRLGIGQLKWELEDLAFRYLNPQIYKKIATSLTESRSHREDYLSHFIEVLENHLNQEGIKAEIRGRPKHIYSIWKKMQRKQVDFKNIYDLRAVRIIVDQVATCYSTLGIIHGVWQYIAQEFDDYIANPKTNGYQSLHTVVVGPENALVEIQVRTREMDQFAELGVAAHWRYKEGGKYDSAATKSVESLRKLLEHSDDDNHFLDDFKTDLYTDRIFVLTPNGELKELPKGATPLDFAYSIHTEIGHRCRGAKVNQKIVPLTYTLQSGDQVEILTSRDGVPNQSWLDPHLGYLKTSGARSKVRHWFRKQNHEQNLRDGKAIFDKKRQLKGIKEFDKSALVRHFRLSHFDELLIALGRAEISAEQLDTALTPTDHQSKVLEIHPVRKPSAASAGDAVVVQGVDNLLTAFAQCCKPIPGDAIVGFISGSKGIVIHRKDCRNIRQLTGDKQDRIIEVGWGEKNHDQAVDVLIQAIDRSGLLRDITQVLANEHINIQHASTHAHPKDHSVDITLTLEVHDTAQLSRTLEKIDQLPNVLACSRKI